MSKKNKKNEILAIAEKKFSEMGFERTSVREIANDSQVNMAMISYYFGSKENLLEEIINVRINEIKINLTELLDENINPLVQLETFVKTFINRFDEHRAFYCMLYSELANKEKVINNKVYWEVKHFNDGILKSIIIHGQKKKVFSKSINSLLIQPFIAGPYINFILNKEYYKQMLGLKSEKELTEYITKVFQPQLIKTIKFLLAA